MTILLTSQIKNYAPLKYYIVYCDIELRPSQHVIDGLL
jgi:hypothetical protein